ncbi:bumetanide-sensitive sodium-(potassium)-chloride cotransporter isoform X2 [Phlebotomus argentipes]|uniref:bumetanide-sensitive sodium-(potassium)-chloride cotransporter isoform X2 n=1 Tax=Phlebotomus argentipes TaxID=94469 RepID=UPI002892A57D|nr:bumetanide-sensitive sodium-(potassium)-chloride cotransporter isoform X2 [Phlebotomus argentipes]
MADSLIEMGSVDKSMNRFQVKRVSHGENYRRSTPQRQDNDDEDDTFPEETAAMIARRQSRLSSIKTSFRDIDKPSRFKDLQMTRFQVDSETNDSEEEQNDLLDGSDYDTKIYKSFRHFTREALPRLDNYRNILSITHSNRPTLDELHNATISNKTHGTLQNRPNSSTSAIGMKFGWMQGVLMRCLLNIWGVMLFLRLSWVIGQAGVAQGIILILTTSVVTTITALSMSAISTNGVIKGGGTYYMISRSLGPEFGGSIGLIFSLANAVACAMYVVGFCESMQDLLRSFGMAILDDGVHDVRIIGSITIIALLAIVVIGMEWEAKAQVGLLVILLVAIADFLIGTLIGPKSDLEMAKGFVGYNATVFVENLSPEYRTENGVEHNFFSVFSIFFPAATGILAGANISGDLKDPQKAIPKGTLLAIGITTASYVVMALCAGATVVRDATGNVTDVVNGTLEFVNCTEPCRYGLLNSFQVIELVSGFGPLIYAGCFAATLSSALASLVSAPKVFQALCKDELFPKIKWFARGYGKNDEPVRGYILTFFLAVAFILVGELNLIAPLISNFFLAAYTLINFSTFHASFAKSIGWRPTFKYYNMWLSLIGTVLCVSVMFLISWATALLTFACVIALYLIVHYRKPDVNWGSSTQAQTYKNALMSVQQLNNVEEHVKNYRPQILVLSGLPSIRSILVDFAYLITKNVSLLVCGHVIQSASNQKHRLYMQQKTKEWFDDHKMKAFYAYVDDDDFESGCKALMQAAGIGKLKPNIVMMGYKNDWKTADPSALKQYFNVVHKAFDMYFAVCILRVNNGLDYSKVLGDELTRSIVNVPKGMQGSDSATDLLITAKKSEHGSCDSLSRNDSQASSTSDLSLMGNPILATNTVSILPDPSTVKTNMSYNISLTKKGEKRTPDDPATMFKGPGGSELPREILDDLTIFTAKRKDAVIDVWWLYDDGGLTLLLPYIMSTRRNWNSCKLRVFALANKKAELEFEQRSMASLLAKFRIDYSDLRLLPDITKKPQEDTTKFFNDLLDDYRKAQTKDGVDGDTLITESELLAVKDKTNRYLRLREYLHEHSMKSDLVVMTLPMPRKSIVSAPLYMAWLESMSYKMPPFLFVRGNQSSVLTFYS